MANKPYINARLRNPAETAPVKAKRVPGKTDWVGGVCAILSFLLAAGTLAALYFDFDTLTKFIGE